MLFNLYIFSSKKHQIKCQYLHFQLLYHIITYYLYLINLNNWDNLIFIG